MKLATIDIGTNSAKVLVVEVNPETRAIKPLKEDICLCRLGEGWQSDHVLKPQAIQRTIEGLLRFKKLSEGYGVTHTFVAATMCVREAVNKQAFLDEVNKATGWEVWVMTGEEEARTSYMGARTLFPELEGTIAAIDIGGGSSEWIFDPNNGKTETVILKSLSLGSVALTEKFLQNHPAPESDLKKAREAIRNLLKSIPKFQPNVIDHFLGIGGTVVSLSLMIQPTGKLDPIERGALEQLIHRIAEMDVAQRLAEFPKLEKGRADVILAGGLILHEIMEFFKIESCLISYRGLRYGLIPEAF